MAGAELTFSEPLATFPSQYNKCASAEVYKFYNLCEAHGLLLIDGQHWCPFLSFHQVSSSLNGKHSIKVSQEQQTSRGNIFLRGYSTENLSHNRVKVLNRLDSRCVSPH